MKIQQFFDKDLAHLSYAIVSDGEVALIDPARDPAPYYEYVQKQNAKIVAVIETHPHADFVSSHAEIGATGVTVYASKITRAHYPYQPFDEGDHIKIGNISLASLNTPGHSPDSISVVLHDASGIAKAVFTGDTLLIGDVGRPDLRESGGISQTKENLAKQLFHSLHDKLLPLPDDIIIYPAHGPGSLCGKSMSDELSSTLARQKKENAALQQMTERAFVADLLDNPPPIPKYFKYNVALNRQGAAKLRASLVSVPRVYSASEMVEGIIIIDTRPSTDFSMGHLQGAWNVQLQGKYETWLGSVVAPEEKFYLIALNEFQLDDVLNRTAKIGYELNVAGALVQAQFVTGRVKPTIDLTRFEKDKAPFTIVDVREVSEANDHKVFADSLQIPLGQLRERIMEIPSDKPIVVHCAGGYRSAIGASMLDSFFSAQTLVYDLGVDVKQFAEKDK